MTWTLCTSGSAYSKAGVNASSTITTWGTGATYMNNWSDEAEGFICAETRRDWVTNCTSLSDMIKNVLSNVCSSLIAMNIINYDMSGYTSRQEATTMLDVNDSIMGKGLQFLKDFKSNVLQTP